MPAVKPAIVGLVAAIALGVAAMAPAGLAPDQASVFGIVLVTLSLWATGVVPGYLTSLFFVTALLLAGLAPPEVVFSGFAAAAMWLIVAGFVIGAAITHTGLGSRIGAIARPHLSKSYPMLIGGLMAIGMAMGFLMPSSLGRAAVLVPVGMALADAVGLAPGTRGRIGVAVTIAFATNMPSAAILPSNIPNVILTGVSEKVLGLHVSYGDYLLLHYPVLGLVKSVATVALILLFFPARIDGVTAPELPEAAPDPAAARHQRALLAVLLVTLGLWATDQVHGISPAWIGLLAACVLLVPRLGFVPPPVFRRAVDFGTLLFVAGVLALGAVVSTTGLGTVIADHVMALMPFAPGHDFRNFMSLVMLGTLTAIFTTTPGVPAVLVPLAPNLSAATGFPLEAVVMTQVIGFATPIFPYQVGPLIVAMGMAGESTHYLLRMTLALAGLTLLVLIPLNFLWWRLLGWI